MLNYFNKQQRFSIRKFSVGVASAVLGAFVIANTSQVSADEITIQEPTVVTEEVASSVDVNKMLEELPEKAKLLAMAELREDVNGLGEAYSEATLQALNEVGYFEKRRQLIEEYKVQLLAEQAVENQETTVTNQSEEFVSARESDQNAVTQSQSTDTNKSGLKVLPKTSDTASMLAVFGVMMSLLGLVGLKKRSN